MKKVLFFLIMLSVFFVEGQAELFNSSQQFCVQTFNTHGVFYSDKLEERHQNTLQFLRQNGCDVILLQEVWDEDHYQNLHNLSEEINMESVYFKKPYDDKRSGLVGLFKGEIQTNDVFYFPPSFENGLTLLAELFKTIDKGFGVAQVKTPLVRQDSFLVFNFHLHHISQVERVRQLLSYLELILKNSYSNQAIIAGGDFNFHIDSLEFRIMKNIFQFKNPYEQIGKTPECTHLCEGGKYDLLRFLIDEGTRDYIFFKSSSRVEFDPKDIFVFPTDYNGVFLSDHFGLRAIFQLNNFFGNRSNHTISEKLFEDKLRTFKETLFEVEVFFQNENSMWLSYFSEMSFIKSLYEDLKNPQSSVIQYLKY